MIRSNKSLLIVGGGPSAKIKSEEWYNSFDFIMRMNNYKKTNNSRTDIYFSYFGKNIRKSAEELKADGVKLLVNKCPNADMTEKLSCYNVDMTDYRWIYEYRKDWWFCLTFCQTEEELLYQVKMLGGFMPTVGLSAILWALKYIEPVTIIGYDCFESGLHNLNERWDNSGNHNIEKEKRVLESLENQEKIEWIR